MKERGFTDPKTAWMRDKSVGEGGNHGGDMKGGYK